MIYLFLFYLLLSLYTFLLLNSEEQIYFIYMLRFLKNQVNNKRSGDSTFSCNPVNFHSLEKQANINKFPLLINHCYKSIQAGLFKFRAVKTNYQTHCVNNWSSRKVLQKYKKKYIKTQVIQQHSQNTVLIYMSFTCTSLLYPNYDSFVTVVMVKHVVYTNERMWNFH